VIALFFAEGITVIDRGAFDIIFALRYISLSCVFAFAFAVVYTILRTHSGLELNIVPFNGDKRSRKKRVLVTTLSILLILCGIFCYYATLYMKELYGDVSAASLLFLIINPMQGVNISPVEEFFSEYTGRILIYTGLFSLLILGWSKNNIELLVRLSLKKTVRIVIFPFRLLQKRMLSLSAILFATFAVYFVVSVGAFDILQYYFNSSDFIEKNYTDPQSVGLVFPSQKKNLVYIYLESMETTYADRQSGGSMDNNLIPNLTRIANDNLHFSESDRLGGMTNMNGMDWTASALVAQTAGVPMLISTSLGNKLGDYERYISGAYSLGDILAEQGYNQMVMFGSRASFGGRDRWFSEHGQYIIKDYHTAIADEIIPPEHDEWWGYRDELLYEYAKQEILQLAGYGQPFNFTMLTADTHFPEGYLCDLCRNDYAQQHSNVVSCADRQIDEFLEWLADQDFYEDTVIVIAGDHNNMDERFFTTQNITRQDRKIYNAFINVFADTNRIMRQEFTAVDMFPTTLAAMGVYIPGDRLGLGVNLFSGRETLIEKHGFEYMKDELMKRSAFYNRYIL